MELTTETEKLLQQVEMEEENEHGKRPESSDSSTITTTNTSSSSSFSGFHGEHDEVNNGNVYLDGLQGWLVVTKTSSLYYISCFELFHDVCECLKKFLSFGDVPLSCMRISFKPI